jgi:L-lactate utilization protein LutB
MDYNKLASNEALETTIKNLTANNFTPIVVENKEEALARVKELIPDGASIMNGASETLAQIGYIDYVKSGDHSWKNLHEEILKETDPAKQAQLRRQSVLSDFYVGSVHALTETGELLIASNSGSQLPHIVFTSPNVVFVIGANKIVPTLQDAFTRLDVQVIPLEDERMKKVYGFGTTHAKTVILHKENPMMGRKVNVVIVKEVLGF